MKKGEYLLLTEEESFSIIEIKKDFTKGKEIKTTTGNLGGFFMFENVSPLKNNKIIAFASDSGTTTAKIIQYSVDFSKKIEIKVEKTVDAFNSGAVFYFALDKKKQHAFVLSTGNTRNPVGMKVFSLKKDLKLVSEVKLERNEVVIDFTFAGYFGDSTILMTFSEYPVPFAVTSYEFCSKRKVIFERKDLRYEKSGEDRFFYNPVLNGNGKVLLATSDNQRVDLEYKE